MNKKYVVLLIFICLGIIFTSFFLLTEGDNKTDIVGLVNYKPATQIVFFSSWSGYDTKAKEMTRILGDFQKKFTEFEIVNNSIGGEDFLLSLKTDFASGYEPDVFGLWPGSDIDMLVDTGRVADLTEALKADPEWYASFNEDSWKYVTKNDKIYGLPFEAIYEGLFVRKDIFTELNLKIPTNFQELLVACQVLNENNIIPIAYNDTAEGSFIYQNIVMKLGGKEDVEQPFDEQGHIKLCFIQGMYYMKQLYEAGAFPNNAFRLTDNDRNQLFLNKKAAMILQGSWFVGEDALAKEATYVEVIPFPTFQDAKADATAIIYGCGNGVFHMSEAAWQDVEKKQVCISLLKELTSEETAVHMVEKYGNISNIRSSKDYSAPEMYYVGTSLIDRATELIGPVDSFIDRDIWENIIVEQFSNMLRGLITPEEIFNQVEAAYQSE